MNHTKSHVNTESSINIWSLILFLVALLIFKWYLMVIGQFDISVVTIIFYKHKEMLNRMDPDGECAHKGLFSDLSHQWILSCPFIPLFFILAKFMLKSNYKSLMNIWGFVEALTSLTVEMYKFYCLLHIGCQSL